MSLSHLKLWINNQSTPSGENAGLNKNHNFFTPWPSHDTVVCVDNRRQLCCEHMEGDGAGVHRCCGRWKGLWSCVSPNPSDFRTIPCLRGFAVQCVAHRVVARRRDFRWFPGDLGSLHTVNSGENSNGVLPSTALKSGQSMIVVAHFAHLLIHSHCDLGFDTLCIRNHWCGVVLWCGAVWWCGVLCCGLANKVMTLTARADTHMKVTARANTQMTLTAHADTQADFGTGGGGG